MKRVITTFTLILFIMAGCGENKQSDGILTVDVTKSYPKKELNIQDLFDIEYVPLETIDGFVTHGYVRAMNNDVIITRNYVNDGDLYFFDSKTGKAVNVINRRGQSGFEYINPGNIILDDATGDILVNDASGRKMQLYDKDGNFKHGFKYSESVRYRGIFNFGPDHLLCFDSGMGGGEETDANRHSYEILSKHDGSVAKRIELPFGEKKRIFLLLRDPSTGEATRGAFMDDYPPVRPYGDQFVIAELSADTSYIYSLDHKITPLTVRTPSVQLMDPEVFLIPVVFTDDYYLMIKMEKTWDFETSSGFPVTHLLYDRQEDAIYETPMYNADYVDKNPIKMRYTLPHKDVACWQILDAPELVAAYEEGKLTGKLKEVVSKMDEEDNPVIMLAKYK